MIHFANCIVGRLFDHHMLDMVELGIESFTAMDDFSVSGYYRKYFKISALLPQFIIIKLLLAITFQ